MGRVWSPIAARLGYFNETRAESKRRMTGEVCDGEHFIAQRWNQQQIYRGKDARHFLSHAAPKTVGLDKVHGG